MIVVLLAVMVPGGLSGQGGGAKTAGMAGIAVLDNGQWAARTNPSGLAGNSHACIGMDAERRFLLKELSYYLLGAAIPAMKGSFGVSLGSTTCRQWISQQIDLGYGRPFGDHFYAGLALVYIHQKPGDYATHSHLASYRLGFTYLAGESLSLAFSTFNPFQLYFRNLSYATLPSAFHFGAAYRPVQSISLLAEVEKTGDLPPVFKAGFELNQREAFFIRGGIRFFPVGFSFGAGYRMKRYAFDIASSYHRYLGFTPQISLQYDFRR